MNQDSTLLTYLLELYEAEQRKQIGDKADYPVAASVREIITSFIDFAHQELKNNPPVAVTYVGSGLALQMRDTSILPLLPALAEPGLVAPHSVADGPAVSVFGNSRTARADGMGDRSSTIQGGSIPISGASHQKRS